MFAKKFLFVAGLVCAGVAGEAMAAADQVNVQFTGIGLGRNAQITYNGVTEGVFSGSLWHNFTGGTGPIGSLISGSMLTYCTDMTQWVAFSPSTFDVVTVDKVPNFPGMGMEKAKLIKNMYAAAHDAENTTTWTDDNADYASAFQIAVWEIVADYDGTHRSSLDVTTGSLKVESYGGGALSAGVASKLASLLDASVVDGASYKEVRAVRSECWQDQLVQLNVVPLPGAASMGALGLTGLVARRRRR